MNNLRFLNESQYLELIDLYHLSKTALAGMRYQKYDRMLWASKRFNKLHPSISVTACYKDLETNLYGY